MKSFTILIAIAAAMLSIGWSVPSSERSQPQQEQAIETQGVETAFIFRRIRQRRANGQGFRPVRAVGRLFARSC